jgi:hypothetical protein
MNARPIPTLTPTLAPTLTRFLARTLALTLVFAGALGCDKNHLSVSPTGVGNAPVCSGHPDWRTSPYVLPYPVGVSYTVLTGNCTPGHQGPNRYGYDFTMPIGSPIVAMRGGTVIYVKESNFDSDHVNGTSNHLVIDHGDGTYSTYFHMTHDGIVVEVGDAVRQGELVAYSGASGTGPEHTHVHVKDCVELEVFCESIPFTFSNTRPNPNGLQVGESYEALPYDMTGGSSSPALSTGAPVLGGGALLPETGAPTPSNAGAGTPGRWPAGRRPAPGRPR